MADVESARNRWVWIARLGPGAVMPPLQGPVVACSGCQRDVSREGTWVYKVGQVLVALCDACDQDLQEARQHPRQVDGSMGRIAVPLPVGPRPGGTRPV